MIILKITNLERSALVQITKPSSYKRLYCKLNDLIAWDKAVEDYFSKSNYSKVSDIYIKKSITKQSIIRNQLTLLRLYQYVIESKPDGDRFNLTIQESLIPGLIETLTYTLIRIDYLKSKNKCTDVDKKIESACNSLLDLIENSVKSYDVYVMNKTLKKNKDIISFNDSHKLEKKERL